MRGLLHPESGDAVPYGRSGVSIEAEPGVIWVGIDPGPEQSGLVLLGPDNRVLVAGVWPNESILMWLGRHRLGDRGKVAIEMIASYGMAVGREVFDTCVWIGRFLEAASSSLSPMPVRLHPRQRVKLHLCQSVRAKDANVRQALIDRLGPVGTSKAPGPLFGVSSHAWAALAVALTAAEVEA
jgi:hypothetical protein